MPSAHQDLNPDPSVMADLGWQNWAEFGETSLSIEKGRCGGATLAPGTTLDAHFQDTLAHRYRRTLPPRYTRRCPPASLTTVTTAKNSDRSIVLPLARRYRYALGLQDRTL
jgi:hypothetical protein